VGRMTRLKAPGFLAERSIYRSRRAYNAGPREQSSGSITPAQLDSGCFEACYNHCNWECFREVGTARGQCLRECRIRYDQCRERCTVHCTPSTTCRQDPATTDPRCQICYTDYCDGFASVSHTC
jgi:hypothetical protein